MKPVKGSAVIVFETKYYKHYINSMLERYNPQKTFKKLPRLTSNTWKNGLTAKEIGFLYNLKHKPSLFYGLPKIHKNSHITKTYKDSPKLCINIPHKSELRLRHIIAGLTCEIDHLSNSLDILLKFIS